MFIANDPIRFMFNNRRKRQMRISLPRDVESHKFEMTFNNNGNTCFYNNEGNRTLVILSPNNSTGLLITSLARLNEAGDYNLIQTNVSNQRSTNAVLKRGNISRLPKATQFLVRKAVNRVYDRYNESH